MKALLVSSRNTQTFWSFKYALQFTDRKAVHPPLGLLTVASLLPRTWEKRLIDMNTDQLKDGDIQWADYVFLGAMDMQRESAIEVIDRCNKLGVKVVAGGPFFTENYENLENVDHFVLGEAETTLPVFLKDLENGTPKHLYPPGKWPAIEESPAPMWELIDLKKYDNASIQFSRGCPFNCEFCQITRLFGREVRTKNKEQIINELEKTYNLGWRGSVFFVDDNFIGNEQKLKTEILPAIIEWMRKNDYPFSFYTQASINLADEEELMRMLVLAGFNSVFLGIETPDEECLTETGKFHNTRRDLLADVKKLQRSGLEVWSGFILGFDSDKESIFDSMVRFIQESGVTIAMVGLLTAMKGTRLYKRLEEENRLISYTEIDNARHRTNVISTDYAVNFIPKMDSKTLIEGYRKVLKDIYSPEPYYLRLAAFFRNFSTPKPKKRDVSYETVKSLIKVIIVLGILDKGRVYFWRLIFWSLFKRPEHLARLITLWVQGYHFRKVFEI